MDRNSLFQTSKSLLKKEANQSTNCNCNASDLTHPSSSITSNATAHVEATNTIGESSVLKSIGISNSFINSDSDQTLSDLRKAIVGDLIKNPKTFKGNQDDVHKWIEDIEHLLEIAQIADPIRLNLISYSLRGDALEWFKNNRSLFTSWEVFVKELKSAFASSFHGELAFKKLESYTQGANQSIRSFFNEILKLCKEADSTMSETTKLKTLLYKTKPSIQFEVRKRKPTTTSEFLQYAKEAEELLQLSNIDLTPNIDNPSIQSAPFRSSQMTTPSPSVPTSFGNTTNNNMNSNPQYFDNRRGHPNGRYRHYRSRNSNSNYHQPHNSYQNTQNFRGNSQQGTNNNQTNRHYTQSTSSGFQAQHHAPNREHAVNAINSAPLPDSSGSSYETQPPTTCDRCQQFGHEALACPNF